MQPLAGLVAGSGAAVMQMPKLAADLVVPRPVAVFLAPVMPKLPAVVLPRPVPVFVAHVMPKLPAVVLPRPVAVFVAPVMP